MEGTGIISALIKKRTQGVREVGGWGERREGGEGLGREGGGGGGGVGVGMMSYATSKAHDGGFFFLSSFLFFFFALFALGGLAC